MYAHMSNHGTHLEHFTAASTPHTLQLGVSVASHNHTVLILPHTPLLLLLLLCLLRLALLLWMLLVLSFLGHYRLLATWSLPGLLQ